MYSLAEYNITKDTPLYTALKFFYQKQVEQLNQSIDYLNSLIRAPK
jgi:hypothetical protein